MSRAGNWSLVLLAALSGCAMGPDYQRPEVDAPAADLDSVDNSTSEVAEPDREPTDAEKVADVEWQDYMDSHPQTGIRDSGGDG